MSNAAHIAVHTATVNGHLSAHSRHRCRSRHAKLMLLKDSIVALRQKGTSFGRIGELLATADLTVSTATIARFLAEVSHNLARARQRRRFAVGRIPFQNTTRV